MRRPVRENMDDLREELTALGADHVLTYSELSDKGFRSRLADLTSSSELPLALNCVGGPATTAMAKLLGRDGTLVTYGGMSMQPVSLPSSLFIFKNITSAGFWMTTWYKGCTPEERRRMTDELCTLMRDGKLREPAVEVVRLSGSDDEIGRTAREAIKDVKGKKVLFQFADA